MMPWQLLYIPSNLWFELCCKPCLEDLYSLEICFLALLFLQICMPFLNAESY
ncbi:hypothetical protein ACHAXS_001413 [Conticribra weissflogii]